ncbi:hypothetical protein K6119_00370 [Paracrocinitomix mangrovi]|uniref:hypothetical protein n=1 Tax=Paracrocinitomix mangrovi TaxID=2862509 RepID=UPI001C8D7BD8|nr:hypothetical protein [Paracrocinitomix mangrovi]UKN01968.1 hypothetical protein K6119_00370 [Paracrocinitomix mangrovi]
MQFLRSIIISSLILTYFVGFAHRLIPHYNEVQMENVAVTEHHHEHENGHTANDGDSHVVHEDHIDADFFDYLLCLLSDLEHQGNENEHHPQEFVSEKSAESRTDKAAQTNADFSVFLKNDISIAEAAVKTTVVDAHSIIEFESLEGSTHSLRGPPYFTC